MQRGLAYSSRFRSWHVPQNCGHFRPFSLFSRHIHVERGSGECSRTSLTVAFFDFFFFSSALRGRCPAVTRQKCTSTIAAPPRLYPARQYWRPGTLVCSGNWEKTRAKLKPEGESVRLAPASIHPARQILSITGAVLRQRPRRSRSHYRSTSFGHCAVPGKGSHFCSFDIQCL